ncbi:hypothetical protein ABZ476_11185, partial [Streptomyces albogriseolus]
LGGAVRDADRVVVPGPGEAPRNNLPGSPLPEALDGDPLLTRLERERRDTLVAGTEGAGTYRFDIRLQGEGETVFLEFP